jgi:hypothetical protein
MKKTALAIGSRGDLQPFVELGKGMVRRGSSRRRSESIKHDMWREK